MDSVFSMGARVCITCIRLLIFLLVYHVILVSLGRVDRHDCLLFCLVKWVCYMKPSSVHNTRTDALGTGG